MINKTKWYQYKEKELDDIDNNDIVKPMKRSKPRAEKEPINEENEEKAKKREAGVESAIFIPYTKGSALKRALQKWDNQYTASHNMPKVRFMEKGGPKIKTVVCKSNPWENKQCERELCGMCGDKDSKNHGKCKHEGITYEIKCDECKDGGNMIKCIGLRNGS